MGHISFCFYFIVFFKCVVSRTSGLGNASDPLAVVMLKSLSVD